MPYLLYALLFALPYLGCGKATNPISYDGPIVGTWRLVMLDGQARDDSLTVIFHPDGRHETLQPLDNGSTISLITTYRITDSEVRIDTRVFRFDVGSERLILIDRNDRIQEYLRVLANE